jgi:hypothetical protein
MTTGKAIPAAPATRAVLLPCRRLRQQRTGGTQGWGSLMEGGARQRGLAASGEQ